jgi:hypothetical protein
VVVDGAPNYLHRHELDRFNAALHFDFMELTVGRQAIGLGRGVLFSAIDVFAPFSPNEVDREWRRGVDAVHLELRIPDLEVLSGDVFLVLGNIESGELSSFSLLGRLRAVVGDVDGELVVGRRGEDGMVGGALSATVGDAELHGELALFGTNGDGVESGFFGTRGVVAKGVVGGSYMIDVLRGIRVVLEYHYSGFGVENVGRDASILFDAAYQLRALSGHSQTLGRHTPRARAQHRADRRAQPRHQLFPEHHGRLRLGGAGHHLGGLGHAHDGAQRASSLGDDARRWRAAQRVGQRALHALSPSPPLRLKRSPRRAGARRTHGTNEGHGDRPTVSPRASGTTLASVVAHGTELHGKERDGLARWAVPFDRDVRGAVAACPLLPLARGSRRRAGSAARVVGLP